MLIGYARVSKSDRSQALNLQWDALQAAGIDEGQIYHDRVSGKTERRLGLDACLKALQPGNTLVAWTLDRLIRDLKHLISAVDGLRQRDVGFKVLSGAGAEIDTTTANGRLFFAVFAALAEYEREVIAERTRAGLQAARARGRVGGRPRKMDKTTLQMAMTAMSDPQTCEREVAAKLGITTTLYMYVNGNGSLKPAGEKVFHAS